MTAPAKTKASITALREKVDELTTQTNGVIGDLLNLAEAVVRDHDDHHTGPRMWCPHTACRKADEVLS